MNSINSRTLLAPTRWADGAATTTQTAGVANGAAYSAANGEQAGAQTTGATPNNGVQQAGAATAAANGKAADNAGQSSTDNSATTNANAATAPVTFTPEQQEAVNKIVSAKLAEERSKQQRKQKRDGATQQIKDGEADGDLQKALDGERTLRTDAETRVAELEVEVASLKRANAVIRVANRHTLPAELVKLLEDNASITDEASAEAVAKTLTKFKPTQTAPETDAGKGNRAAATKAATGSSANRENSVDKLSARYANRGDVEWPS